jgi:hypothetical protein
VAAAAAALHKLPVAAKRVLLQHHNRQQFPSVQQHWIPLWLAVLLVLQLPAVYWQH